VSGEVWIGMADVEASDSARNAGGAYVQVVATATSSDHFIERATAVLRNEGYRVLEFEDVEPLEGRRRPGEVLGRPLALARRKALHGRGRLRNLPPLPAGRLAVRGSATDPGQI
jgi:hypothetical protein